MLGIIILIFIGRQFSELAKRYEQKLSWIYFIVGIIAYYGAGFIGGVLLAIYFELTGNIDAIDDISDLTLGLISIVLGVLSCWGTYQLLKKKWHKEHLEKERNKPKISDIGRSTDDL
jgi:ABC-type antimicrobial peptide transport system permease subunit